MFSGDPGHAGHGGGAGRGGQNRGAPGTQADRQTDKWAYRQMETDTHAIGLRNSLKRS
jgi:hypothetical protein